MPSSNEQRKPLIGVDGEVREITEDDLKFVRRGGPPIPDQERKKRINLMLDPDVVEKLKKTGNMSDLKPLLTLYFLATFLQAGTYGLTFLLPPLFESFGANEKDVGTVLASTTASTLIVVLSLGHITERLGRVNTIVLASVLIAASLALFGQATQYGPMLFVAGLLLGAGWGLFYVLTPVVLAEITSKDDRVRAFTLLSVFIMAGFGLSPVLGAYLSKSQFGIASTFTLTAGLCLISGVIFMKLRKPIASLSISSVDNDHSGLDWTGIKVVIQSRALRPIVMVGIGASVFAAVTNFQTVYASEHGLDCAQYFLAYTITVIICRVLFAEFVDGHAPYGVIAILLAVMVISVVCFLFFTDSQILYILGAVLFGIGYGVSYPIVKAMAANDANPAYMSQTLQLFGLSYFIGVFGFPFVAGWIITTTGIATLLTVAAVLSVIESVLAARRYQQDSQDSRLTH